jgi:hypothetical protein
MNENYAILLQISFVNLHAKAYDFAKSNYVTVSYSEQIVILLTLRVFLKVKGR